MKTFKHIVLTLMAASGCCPVFAQEPATWDDFIEQVAETGHGEDENEGMEELRLEELSELYAQGLDLNKVTVDELLQLPFLTEEQARDIVYYRDMQGPLRSTGELLFIESLGRQEREYLQLFCYAGEVSDRDALTPKLLLRRIRSEAVVRTDIPFYYKAGHADYPETTLSLSPNKQYRGDPTHLRLRYSLNSMNHLQAGIQAEKDAGERGIDYVSGYLLLRDLPTGRRSKIREAVVGCYRAHFGLGLAINTGVSFGKTMMNGSLGRMDRGLSRHSSAQETGYLTGAGIRWQLGGISMTIFGAYDKTDGTLLADSTGISALKTDGLHRTPLEQSKRHNTGVTNVGANVHCDLGNWQLSATGVGTHYSTPLTPKWDTEASLYRKFNAQGQDFQTYSLAYSFGWKSLSIAGEAAVSHADGLPDGSGRQNGLALLQTVVWRIGGKNTLRLAARRYGAKFVSINGRAFGENSRPQNEQGIFMGWTTRMVPRVNIDAYIDLMHFPWLKYGVSNRSYGMEGMVQATYRHGKSSNWLLRYKVKSKQKDLKDDMRGTTLQYNTRHSLKLQYSLQAGRWSMKALLNGCMVDFGTVGPEWGWAAGCSARWTGLRGRLKVDGGLTYFSTDSYNARVYAYEPSLLYSFGMMSYYGRGIRALAMVSWTAWKGLSLVGKLGMTKYSDRDHIGTGTEEIMANHREDLQLMVRWKF